MNMNTFNNSSSYIVKSGDSLYAIAKKYHTTVDELMKINLLSSPMIYPNQVLFIPKGETDTDGTYLTKMGDSIGSILNMNHINLNTFLKYNDIEKMQLMGNQLVKVSNTTNDNLHILGRGENVDDVLSRYHTSPYELLKLNENIWFNENKKIIIK